MSVPLRLPIRLGIGLVRLIRRKPIILGQELAGEIEAVGKEVTRFKKGDQVFGWTGITLGAYAQYKCLPEKGLVVALKPSNMTYEEAATLPVGGLDATDLLRKAHIRSGEKILIIGAGGSIGTYAVQIARHLGAVVTGVDSSDKLDMLRSIGADQVIDYKKEDYTRTSEKYDVIFDVVGKSRFSRTAKLLTPNGRFLSANPIVSQRVRARWILGRSRQYIPWSSRSASEYAEEIAFLKALIEAGHIKAIVDKCFPLEQIADAHRYVEAGRKKGHIVVTLRSEPEGKS